MSTFTQVPILLLQHRMSILLNLHMQLQLQLHFLLFTDSEAPGFGARLAPFQSLQQAALQRPPPLCGLLAAQLQLTGEKQLGPGFEFGELWQRSVGREPLRLGKVCPFSAQRGPGHVCHS